MDFGAALRNWRDPSHPAGPPRSRKRRRTGAGSFRAASGVAQLRYDGKRRIRLPVIGSVKLAHTLPKGIPYEAHISRRNGRWLLSVKYWREPAARPEPDTRIAAGDRDQPSGNRLRGTGLGEPEGILSGRAQAATMAEGAGLPYARQPWLVGGAA